MNRKKWYDNLYNIFFMGYDLIDYKFIFINSLLFFKILNKTWKFDFKNKKLYIV